MMLKPLPLPSSSVGGGRTLSWGLIMVCDPAGGRTVVPCKMPRRRIEQQIVPSVGRVQISKADAREAGHEGLPGCGEAAARRLACCWIRRIARGSGDRRLRRGGEQVMIEAECVLRDAVGGERPERSAGNRRANAHHRQHRARAEHRRTAKNRLQIGLAVVEPCRTIDCALLPTGGKRITSYFSRRFGMSRSTWSEM